MSLLDTFVQVFEFDTSQADAGFNRIDVSIDDLIESMKKAQEASDNASDEIDNVGSAVGSLSEQYQRYAEIVRTKGVKAALEEARAQAQLRRELNNTTEARNETGASIASLGTRLLAFAGITASVTSAVSDAINRAAEIESLDNLGRKIHVATEDVDAFVGSVAELGGTRESASSDLEALAGSFGKTSDKMEAILRVADQVKGLSFDKAKAKLGALGVGDDKTVELLRKGRTELERTLGIQKQYSGITKESIEQARKFNQAMNGFKQSAGLLKNSFLETIIPYLTMGLAWISKFVDFCRDNKDLITGFFIAIGAILAGYYRAAILNAVAANLAFGASLIVAYWPVLLIIAAISALAAAFALVYDDIMNFIDGNESLTGKILKAYPWLQDAALALMAVFRQVFGFLSDLVSLVADIFVGAFWMMSNAAEKFVTWLIASVRDIAGWGKSFTGAFSGVADDVVGIFNWMWEQVKKILGWIGDGLESVKKGWSTVKGWFGGESEQIDVSAERKITGEVTHRQEVDDMVATARAHTESMNNNPINSLTSQAISNRSNVRNENNISIGELNVSTQATDAKGVAEGMKGELQEQLQDLGQQMQTGMIA